MVIVFYPNQNEDLSDLRRLMNPMIEELWINPWFDVSRSISYYFVASEALVWLIGTRRRGATQCYFEVCGH